MLYNKAASVHALDTFSIISVCQYTLMYMRIVKVQASTNVVKSLREASSENADVIECV